MEKGNEKSLTTSFQKLHLSPISKSKPSVIPPTFQSSRSPIEKTKPPSLESLCLGVVGKHFEDIIGDLGEIAVNFPADTKMAMAAIARRRQLLNDDVIISLAESSWEILDISGSDVSDFGLAKVAERCKVLRAVDIRIKDIKGKNLPLHMVPSRICSTNLVTFREYLSFYQVNIEIYIERFICSTVGLQV
ncbi:hypothetical protein CK203_021497 [Vitis vinifera]|uniref:Uncharacterized protein n=1 Tax=Vitis vinifera TaxID=29760 RepID=A0A438DXV8_VITVI|nr:hypothetical protein CK203_078349 [Vitis vinifera]RVW99571.1 hypothetical protein CK203_021497 [Vitis vinifera]